MRKAEISGRAWWLGPALMAAAVLERIWLLQVYAPVAYGDTGAYFRSAAVLSRGSLEGYDGTRVPGYPLFVAALGLDPHRVWLGQMALGLGITLLLYLWTLRATSSSPAAFIVGALYNLIPGQFLFEANLLTETLTTFLVLLALYLVERTRAEPVPARAVAMSTLAGVTAAAAGLVRILFYPLAVWLAAVAWLGTAGSWKARLGRSAPLALSASILLGGWVGFIDSTYGFLAPSTMGGYNLVQHTGVFFEYLPDEYAPLRDTYLKYRDARIAARGDQTNAIWDAIPELREVTGLGFYDLSRELQRVSLQLILDHPDLYARNVVQGWLDFWKAPAYWEPAALRLEGRRALVSAWSAAGRGVSVAASAAFLLIVVLALIARRGALAGLRRNPAWWSAAGLVLGTSVLQTLLDHGDNPRFLVPLQMVVIFCVGVALHSVWRARQSSEEKSE
jgi:hypothetical protein